MKVILLTDVPKVGKKYEVKDFKEGYAQNVLLSRGLAELATPHALAKIARYQEALNNKKQDEKAAFDKLINSLHDKKILVKANANEKGHLFKAVSSRDVVEAIKATSGLDIEENLLKLNNIKELGSHEVLIKKGEREGRFEILVESK